MSTDRRSMLRLALALVVVVAPFVPAFAQSQEASFDSEGVPIHYVEAGQGDPLVLIHGNGGGVDTWIRLGILANLAKDFRVIALDLRGFGKSGKPHSPADYGPEMGLDVIRLLDHLGIRKAHIVGYSMGANIVAHLLVTHPNRFLTATLGGQAGRETWTASDFDRVERAAAEWEQGRPGPALFANVLTTWPTDEPRPPEDSIRRRQEATLENPDFDRLAQAALLRSFRAQTSTPAQAAAVTVPTLGVVGSADPALAKLRTLKALRPSLKLVVIDGATHAGPRGALGRPEFLAAIRDFIASRRGSNPR